MLFMLGALVLAGVIIVAAKAKSATNMHQLGSMSERWVAEHRAAERL